MIGPGDMITPPAPGPVGAVVGSVGSTMGLWSGVEPLSVGSIAATVEGEMRAAMNSNVGRKRRDVRMVNLLRIRDKGFECMAKYHEGTGHDLLQGRADLGHVSRAQALIPMDCAPPSRSNHLAMGMGASVPGAGDEREGTDKSVGLSRRVLSATSMEGLSRSISPHHRPEGKGCATHSVHHDRFLQGTGATWRLLRDRWIINRVEFRWKHAETGQLIEGASTVLLGRRAGEAARQVVPPDSMCSDVAAEWRKATILVERDQGEPWGLANPSLRSPDLALQLGAETLYDASYLRSVPFCGFDLGKFHPGVGQGAADRLRGNEQLAV